MKETDCLLCLQVVEQIWASVNIFPEFVIS